MSFGDIRTVSLREFIAAERAPAALWIFLHIPKTAGSSFSGELASIRPPYKNIHIDYSDQSRSHSGKMDLAVENFIKESESKRYNSCSGHMTMDHVLRIEQAVPDSKIITFLRNPLARVLSDFRYARTPAHPPYKQFIQDYPTLLDYVLSPESQNKMTRFLRKKVATAADVPSWVCLNLSFIGLVEMYPFCFNVISRLFGEDVMPTVYKRRTEETAENQIEITASIKSEILRCNELDVALYSYVKESLVGKREQWTALRRNTE